MKLHFSPRAQQNGAQDAKYQALSSRRSSEANALDPLLAPNAGPRSSHDSSAVSAFEIQVAGGSRGPDQDQQWADPTRHRRRSACDRLTASLSAARTRLTGTSAAAYLAAQLSCRDGVFQAASVSVQRLVAAGLLLWAYDSAARGDAGSVRAVAGLTGAATGVIGVATGARACQLIALRCGVPGASGRMRCWMVSGAVLGALPVLTGLVIALRRSDANVQSDFELVLTKMYGASLARMLGQTFRDFLVASAAGAFGSLEVLDARGQVLSPAQLIANNFDFTRLLLAGSAYGFMSLVHNFSTRDALAQALQFGPISNAENIGIAGHVGGLRTLGYFMEAGASAGMSSVLWEFVDGANGALMQRAAAAILGLSVRYKPARRREEDQKCAEFTGQVWANASLRIFLFNFVECAVAYALTCEDNESAGAALFFASFLMAWSEARGHLAAAGMRLQAEQTALQQRMDANASSVPDGSSAPGSSSSEVPVRPASPLPYIEYLPELARTPRSSRMSEAAALSPLSPLSEVRFRTPRSATLQSPTSDSPTPKSQKRTTVKTPRRAGRDSKVSPSPRGARSPQSSTEKKLVIHIHTAESDEDSFSDPGSPAPLEPMATLSY